MNLDKEREIFGEVVLLTYHARIFFLSFDPNIEVLGFCTLLLVRIFFVYSYFNSYLEVADMKWIEPHSPRTFV
jgi:hypothetical protein